MLSAMLLKMQNHSLPVSKHFFRSFNGSVLPEILALADVPSACPTMPKQNNRKLKIKIILIEISVLPKSNVGGLD